MVLNENKTIEDKYSLESLRKDPERVYIQIYKEYKKEFLSWGKKNFIIQEDDLTDAFQDAIIVLHNNIKQERLKKLESSLKTYLFGIGKNILLKKMQRRKDHIIASAELKNNGTIDLSEELYSGDEMTNKVSSLLEEMTEPCKSILKHFYFNNYSMDKIAVILDYKNADTVKSQKLRCIKYLKNAFQLK
jgi:RNA polymerase sigma-70 factor (ECF subfamily)